MVKKVDLAENRENYLNFLDTRKTLILNMLDEEGKPFSSITPFIKKDGNLYIYISQVADHYRHMENNEWIDAMVIADESETKNPFATERARWRCRPTNIGNEGHDDIFALFNSRFNANMMDVLRGLDFSLFELKPSSGRYVVGFGLAFDIDIDGQVFNHVVVDKKKKEELVNR